MITALFIMTRATDKVLMLSTLKIKGHVKLMFSMLSLFNHIFYFLLFCFMSSQYNQCAPIMMIMIFHCFTSNRYMQNVMCV